jgi:hypothetical protein
MLLPTEVAKLRENLANVDPSKTYSQTIHQTRNQVKELLKIVEEILFPLRAVVVFTCTTGESWS